LRTLRTGPGLAHKCLVCAALARIIYLPYNYLPFSYQCSYNGPQPDWGGGTLLSFKDIRLLASYGRLGVKPCLPEESSHP